MNTTIIIPLEAACTACGDAWPVSELEDDLCPGCANEREGLCPCGGPAESHGLCGPCTDAAYDDLVYHARF